MDYTYLQTNLKRTREAYEAAAKSAGYDPASITLMAAIKSAEVEEINYLHRTLGVHYVGENRVQQLLERYDRLDREGLHIHFIGSLQTNKVKYIIDKVELIQSLDSEHLAREIERQAAKIGRVMDVLIEINSGEEAAKGGVAPADTAAFAELLTGGDFPHIRLCGFMTMAPRSTEEAYHIYFADTRRLCESIWAQLQASGRIPAEERMVLSMGMSESFIPAAAEGATMLRVGRRLFQKEGS